MRIAIIGSGVSGLTAAYLLAPHAHVTLYEKDDRLGGHANTAILKNGDETVPVDTGFMVFNPGRYPYFCSLLKSLEIETLDTDMSFSVSIPGSIEYSGSFAGIFGDIHQLVRPTYVRFILEIPRFNSAAKSFLNQNDSTLSMGEFLTKHKFSPELATWYVFPMISSIWSTDIASIDDFPALETLRFLDNHQLLSILGGPQWKTVQGGSIRYVESLQKILEKEGVQILKNQNIRGISRSPIRVQSDTIETFDAIILATHANDAAQLLTDKNTDEIGILGSFSYAQNTAVLHRDISFLPKRKSAWAAWNYHTVQNDSKKDVISLTYNMNALQHIAHSFPVMVTLNPQKPISSEKVFKTYEYSHPIANSTARAAQKRRSLIQGNRNTYFTGAHWGNGFHEDGVVSAIEAVESLHLPIRI